MGPTNFGTKKKSDPKNILVNKFWVQKSFWSIKTSFVKLNVWVQINFQVQFSVDKMSTPDLPYGDPFVRGNIGPMEYSIWHQKVTIWSTQHGTFLEFHGVQLDQLQMILYIDIWSTPYDNFLMPDGVLLCGHYFLSCEVLHIIVILVDCERIRRAP